MAGRVSGHPRPHPQRCNHILYNVGSEVGVKQRSVGIRELKAKLSECVREVKTGTTIVVTDHGKRVARIVPEADSLEERLETLKMSSTVQWSGRRLQKTKPEVRTRGKRTVADLVVENRD